MIGQPNRLPAEGEHRFRGSEIDRARPLHFTLDGRAVRGFAGDTVLSAALASGLIGAGSRHGEPLALDERFAPPVLLRSDMQDASRALPMERTPAIGGLELVTLGRARRDRYRRLLDDGLGLLPARRSRLRLNHDGDASFTAPWLDLAPARQINADLAVIGGGLAGMGAALAAAKRGQRVVLVERRQSLGGEARFFGSTGDEEAPEAAIDRLTRAVAASANITVLLQAEAFALFEGIVQVSLVETADDVPVSRVLTVGAPRIVLANGTVERLPIFAGNRRPGIVGGLAAFDRAERFGVWIGRRALLGTSTSFAYRLATQARNAGIAIERIADTRLSPQSRFVEFGKAYGIPMIRATRPLLATAADRYGRGLRLHLDASFDGDERAAQQFVVDQLVLSGGWQPDLTLWHMAGGASRWDAANSRLGADGSVPGIVLAGAVAGYRNASACLRSGEAATAVLFGRSPPAIDDAQIDALHESPDDPTSIAPFDAAAEGDAYLDGGASFTARPAPPSRRLRLWPRRGAPHWGAAEQARPLSVADVAAAVQLGAIPPDDAAIVAQERGVTPGDIVDAGKLQRQILPAAPAAGGTPPAYLAGRFGPKAAVWLVEAADGRRFEIGCLVYANADRAEPLAAIGVIFAAAPAGRSGGLALTARSLGIGSQATVRDISGAIAVQLLDPATRPVVAPVAAVATATASTVTPEPAPTERASPVAEAPSEPTELPLPAPEAPAAPVTEITVAPAVPVPATPGIADGAAESAAPAEEPEAQAHDPAPALASGNNRAERASSLPIEEAEADVAPVMEATDAPELAAAAPDGDETIESEPRSG